MTSQDENLRQTYGRTYDNLMTNRKIFFVISPLSFLGNWLSTWTCKRPTCTNMQKLVCIFSDWLHWNYHSRVSTWLVERLNQQQQKL